MERQVGLAVFIRFLKKFVVVRMKLLIVHQPHCCQTAAHKKMSIQHWQLPVCAPPFKPRTAKPIYSSNASCCFYFLFFHSFSVVTIRRLSNRQWFRLDRRATHRRLRRFDPSRINSLICTDKRALCSTTRPSAPTNSNSPKV